MNGRIWLSVVVLFLCLLVGCSAPPETAKVVQVIDGDTITIEGGYRVRYIGIDTPEVHPVPEAYGTECATVLCLLSDDIDQDYEALKAKGVRFFSEVNEVPEGRYVAFQDPNGNLLELIQK